jgi:hypothetical protein
MKSAAPPPLAIATETRRKKCLTKPVLRQNTIRPVFSMTSSGRPPLVPMMRTSDFGISFTGPHSGACFALGSGASLASDK